MGFRWGSSVVATLLSPCGSNIGNLVWLPRVAIAVPFVCWPPNIWQMALDGRTRWSYGVTLLGQGNDRQLLDVYQIHPGEECVYFSVCLWPGAFMPALKVFCFKQLQVWTILLCPRVWLRVRATGRCQANRVGLTCMCQAYVKVIVLLGQPLSHSGSSGWLRSWLLAARVLHAAACEGTCACVCLSLLVIHMDVLY